jgi:hypothetical protein
VLLWRTITVSYDVFMACIEKVAYVSKILCDRYQDFVTVNELFLF